MSLPNLPNFYSMPWSDSKTGVMTTDSALFMDECIQTLNRAIILLNLISNARIVNDGSVNRGTVVNDALIAPQKTTAEINAFGALSSVPNGSIWFDTDVAKLKVKTAASTIETITSS